MSPARLWPLSALFLVLAIAPPADAARYLEFTVEVDGQTVPPATVRSAPVITRLVQVVAAGLLMCLVLAAVAVIRRSRRQTSELSGAMVDS